MNHHVSVFWHSAAERFWPGEGGEQWSGSTGGEVIIPAVTWSLITPSILCCWIKVSLNRALRERRLTERFVCLIVKIHYVKGGWTLWAPRWPDDPCTPAAG